MAASAAGYKPNLVGGSSYIIPEYQGCPPGVVRGSARQPSMASSVNQTVRLPRWRKLASYSRQFVTLRFCLGMWWRRSWFSLNGKMGIRGQVRAQPPTPSRFRTPLGRSVQQDHRRRYPQLAAWGVACLLKRGRRRLPRLQQAAAMGIAAFARLGQCQLPRRAMQQRHSGLPFQIPDDLAHGRGGEPEPARRSAHRAGRDGFGENAIGFQVEHLLAALKRP